MTHSLCNVLVLCDKSSSYDEICPVSNFLIKKKQTVEERRKTHLLNTYYVTGTGDTEVKVTVVGGYRGCKCQG